MSFLSKIKRKLNKNDDKLIVKPEIEMMLFDAVNMDINNTCNQRCRFCFNSFYEKPINMDVDTFKRMIEVLPLVKDNVGGGYGFYISCIYEPTVNPDFLECLSLIPEIGKSKCFFTTNLARPMDEKYINSMISSNVGFINFSINSLKPDCFEYVTQNKKFNIFKNNLDTLEKVLNDKEGNHPNFRFITMLLEQNSDEIIDLIKYCQGHFPIIISHEIRTPYLSNYDNVEWNKGQLMSKDKVDKLISQIMDLGYPVDIDIRSKDDLKIIDQNDLSNQKNDVLENDFYNISRKEFLKVEDYEYLFLRINPDGTCIDKINNIPISISKDNPRKFFEDKLYELYKNRAEVAHCDNYSDNNKLINGDAFILIDKLSKNPAYIEFSGWCCPDREIDINKLIIKLTGNAGDIHHFYASTKNRFDADEFKSKNKGWCGGFTTYISNDLLKDDIYSVDLLYKNKLNETIIYNWDKLISTK